MNKGGRIVMIVLIVVAAVVVGPKRLEPLWDTAVHDPVLGIAILIVFLLIAMFVIRILRH